MIPLVSGASKKDGSEESVGIIGGMTKPVRIQKTYDHRLRDLVQSTGNIQTAVDLWRAGVDGERVVGPVGGGGRFVIG